MNLKGDAMNHRILTPLAALALLLPAATALVPLPAAAQYGGPVVTSTLIEEFDVRGGRIDPGRELRFRLRGAAYGRAWVDIPGVARGIAMHEVRPGVYEGSYVVRQADDPRAFDRAVATLQASGQRMSAEATLRGRDDDRRRGGWRDDTPPQITDLTPAQGAVVDDNGRVRIGARITDDRRRGIPPESITLRVDGRDVTRDARLRGDEIEYRADLPRGRHTAELVVRDHAGNATRRAWSFDVVDRHARAVPSVPVVPLPGPAIVVPAPAPLEISSHGVDAEWDLRNPAPIRGRTFPFATVRLLVDTVQDSGGGKTQYTVVDNTVRADAGGNFVIVARPLPTPMPLTGDYYQLRLTASNGPQSAEANLRLRHRPG